MAAEFATALSDFDADRFYADVMSGLAERELLARLDWIADCLEPHLAGDFPSMADQLEAAMGPELDPGLQDDDFGRFIHAVPGILAVRHGLENHRDRALDLLYAATKRFSMEFYIRPFLNRWPEETFARLEHWAGDENYHVRRLVSEGMRPKLPWAAKVTIDPMMPLPLLDQLHADPTRYVTRSVANHLNDIAKFAPDVAMSRLVQWHETGRQDAVELAWMARHALRTLVKQGHPEALKFLGYHTDIDVAATIQIAPGPVRIGGVLEFTAEIETYSPQNILVDYVLYFHRPGGRIGRKVFKLKQGRTGAAKLLLNKQHALKGNATTFTLYPGPHRIELQVNGQIVAEVEFDLMPQSERVSHSRRSLK
ncbi:hypothetical protein [uncultured Roseovarius sp.]|uniref:hypothetical protein n=1 Tax=uncultured Roseovarius sp. TaxID=293344 RepID=UPI0026222AB6|nr:hypothetical protein [uncultured Roseovarius sp.]